MSGGHFNNNGYIYYQVHQFADELENDIMNNDNHNEYEYAPHFNEKTLSFLKQKMCEIKKISEIMRAIDYLYSGDYGEDAFFEAISNIEKMSDK